MTGIDDTLHLIRYTESPSNPVTYITSDGMSLCIVNNDPIFLWRVIWPDSAHRKIIPNNTFANEKKLFTMFSLKTF